VSLASRSKEAWACLVCRRIGRLPPRSARLTERSSPPKREFEVFCKSIDDVDPAAAAEMRNVRIFGMYSGELVAENGLRPSRM